MKTLAFAIRNAKEMLRDKLNLVFGIGFPVIVLLLLSLIQSNIPVDLFEIEQLAPGIAVFGLSFISLFSGMLIAKDRTGAFMLRLFTSPMTAPHFILGYTAPLVPGRCTDGGMLRSGPLTGVNMQCADFACNGCIDSCRAAFYWDWSALWERIQ